MTTPYIPDGVYKFFNGKYTAYVADHFNGDVAPSAAIGGYTDGTSNHKHFTVTNLGNNRVILESVSAPGHYASAPILSNGVPIFGSQNPTIWTVVAVTGGEYYQFATEDGQLVWILPQTGDFVTITLKPATSATGTKVGTESYWAPTLVSN